MKSGDDHHEREDDPHPDHDEPCGPLPRMRVGGVGTETAAAAPDPREDQEPA